MLWRPALTSRASPSQSSRRLSPCISPRWRLVLRPQTRRSRCWETERGQGFAWVRGWKFAPPASPALWTGTSCGDSSSRGLAGRMCGPLSIASSQTRGPRCTGPLVTSVWWEWNGACGPPTARAHRWWSCPGEPTIPAGRPWRSCGDGWRSVGPMATSSLPQGAR